MEYYIGKTIKQLRIDRKWSQKDLAKRINKSISTISGYESDAHPVPLDVLVTIAQLYDVTLDELVGAEKSESLSLKGMTDQQIDLMKAIRKEFLFPTGRGKDLSEGQMKNHTRCNKSVHGVRCVFLLTCIKIEPRFKV